ncbi:hypothetical protein BS78_02G232100 [Paspalum vaginatum]|nr:hypothetical protein BS78_02G232100 [Paspalum vaginatum]
MENLDYLAIRFHFGGAFVNSNGKLEYVGGGTAMSYVDVDKVSFPELKGHLADHMPETNVVRLHWLMPGKDLSIGLMLLVDDASCSVMRKHITDGGVAKIYVENVDMDADQGFEASQSECVEEHGAEQLEEDDEADKEQDAGSDTGSESSDADFMPPPNEDSSADDEEVVELRKFAKEIKRNIKAKKKLESMVVRLERGM